MREPRAKRVASGESHLLVRGPASANARAASEASRLGGEPGKTAFFPGEGGLKSPPNNYDEGWDVAGPLAFI